MIANTHNQTEGSSDNESDHKQSFSITGTRGAANNQKDVQGFQITHHFEDQSIKEKNSDQQEVKILQIDEEYDMFDSGPSQKQTIPKQTSKFNLQASQHRRNPSAQVQNQNGNNYMDVMIVEDTNEEDLDRLLEQKRNEKNSNYNSDVRGSFLVQSPSPNFDYFNQQPQQIVITQHSDDTKSQQSSSTKGKSSVKQKGRDNKEIFGSQISTQSKNSSKQQQQLQQNQQVQEFFISTPQGSSKNQEFVVNKISDKNIPAVVQIEEQKDLEVNIVPQDNDEDYMDKFFGQAAQAQEGRQTIGRRRNRRTSPLNMKVQDFKNKFMLNNKDMTIETGDMSAKYSQQKASRIQDMDMLDGGFKIDSKNQSKQTTNNVSNDTMKNDTLNLNKKQSSKYDYYQKYYEKIQQQQEQEKIDDYLPPKREKSPDIESINEDTIEESEQVSKYLKELQHYYDQEKKLQQQIEQLEQRTQDQFTQNQLSQLRQLQDSIVSSITEKLNHFVESNNNDYQYVDEEDQILRFEPTLDFTKDFYTNMHQDVLQKDMSPRSKKRVQLLQKFNKDEWDYKDIIRIIDWNERRHREVAQQQLKQNSVISLQDVSTKDIRIRVLTQFQTMNSVSNKMLKEKSYSQARATCVALTTNLVLIGNTEGQLWMFNRENEEEYANFSEKSKDFLGNSVTALDVHQLRPEYVVLGYERGQIVLIDIQEPKKSLKVIKDHHKLPIMNIKFCDWQDGKHDGEDKQAWMFVSVDQQGQVIINSISKVLFILKASKHIVVDPIRYDGPIYASIASRFQQEQYDFFKHENDANIHEYNRSYEHGAHDYDSIPMVAIGNANQVDIIEVGPGKHHIIMTIDRPTKYYNKSTNELSDFKPRVPSLSWGYGNTPAIRDRAHSILAIAWGPLIQLVVLFDSIGTNNQQPFISDGFYVIRNFGTIENPFHKLPNQTSSQSFSSRRSTVSKYKEFKQSITQSNSVQSTPSKENKNSTMVTNDDLRFEATSETENREVTQQLSNLEFQESKEYDDSEAFTQSGMDIEQIQFFSDSTLLIVTKQQEIRILNVSSFHPDTYDAEQEQQKFLSNSTSKKKPSKQKPKLDISEEVELEYGLMISSQLQKSEYGALYHQTIRFCKGKIIALTIKNIQQCSHITWQQSIYEFKKIVEDDLVLVFSRALDIFKGNVKGYSGIPDNQDSREQKLKTEIKLLVKEIIQQVIHKTKQATNILKTKKPTSQTSELKLALSNNEDQQSSSIDQSQQIEQDFKDEKEEKYKTLIRIAIEFCVELKDQRFLFFDLFLLFKNEKLEDAFIHELEPFIMAGKFQEWELPNEVIQNHVLKYYKDSQRADQLEKIIVNLNLAQCPKTIVLEFIHYSEQNFLTTAILYLYTQVFEKKDNTSCVQILFSLFDLYKKAGKKNQGLLIDIQNLKEFSFDSKEKYKVEKSQIYLGYKILWVIRMFLNGQKFPQGQIKQNKWKTYIHDIIELLHAQDILKVLLEIDAETFFQTISIVFFPSRPSELFDQGRDEDANGSIMQHANRHQEQPISNHAKFVKSIDQCCMNLLTKESIKYQYLQFATNVISQSFIQGLDNNYYYNIAKESLQQYKRLIENNKKLQQLQNSKNQRNIEKLNKYRKTKNLKSIDQKPIPDMQYLLKTESDILNLIDRSEPMDQFQIIELSKLADSTQFNQVKILLMEKRQEYLKCLNMFLHEFEIDLLWTDVMQKERVVKWIREKIIVLDEKVSESVQDKNLSEQFKREVQQNIGKILVINPAETIHLVEEFFQSQHKEMVNSLQREPQLQLLYLDTLLVEKQELIEKTIKTHGLQSSNPQDAKKFIELLKLHLRLSCKYAQEKVLAIVQKMVKDVYYPIEDCLEICQEFNITEATFLLTRKVGKYFDCIKLGIQILQDKVEYEKMKIEIYHAYQNNISLNFQVTSKHLPQVKQFDSLFKQIMNICKKNYKDVEKDKEQELWYMVVEKLQSYIQNPLFSNKFYTKQFFRNRLQIFSEQLVRAIPFKQYLQHELTKNKWLRFKEFGEIIQTELSNQASEHLVLSNANTAIFKVNTELFSEYQMSSRRGILFRQRLCFMCKRYMDSFLYNEYSPELSDQQLLLASRNEEELENDNTDTYNQPIKMFACQHTFHLACLEKHFKRRKKNESDQAYYRRIEKLRCPTCNLKSYELENLNGPRAQRRTPRSNAQNQLQQQPSTKFDFGRLDSSQSIIIKNGNEQMRKKSQFSSASDDQMQNGALDKTELWERERLKRLAKENAEKKRQMELIQKRMDKYDMQMDIEGLSTKDFKKVM